MPFCFLCPDTSSERAPFRGDVARAVAVALFALFAFSALADRQIDPQVPQTLFVGSVNLTWAANHSSFWKELGVDGFAVEGVCRDLITDIWEVDGDPSTRALADALYLEVRAAHLRLAEQELDANFLTVPFQPERPYFTDPESGAKAVETIAQAAEFARLCGFKGVVLDTRASSLFYQFDWDGWPSDISVSALKEAAFNWGKSAADKLFLSFPEAQLLIRAEPPWTSGPLWFPMLSGIVAACSERATSAPTLLTEATCDVSQWVEVSNVIEQVDQMIALNLEPGAQSVWNAAGGVAAGLRPIERTGQPGDARALISPSRFRAVHTAASLSSTRYTWLDGGDAWWSLSMDEARKLGELHQLGPEAAAQTIPTVTDIHAYRIQSGLRGYRRIGLGSIEGAPAWFLSDEDGAAAIVAVASSLVNSSITATEGVDIRDLVIDQELSSDDAESDRLQIAGPLPMRDVGLSAALWVDPGGDVSPAMVPIRYGWRNPTRFSVTGSIDISAPPGVTIQPPGQRFQLGPGEVVEVAASIVGTFDAGDMVECRVTVTLSTSPPASRPFSISIQPTLLWQSRLDGPGATQPLPLPDTLGDSPLFVVADRGGSVTAWSQGGRRWRQSIEGAARFAPVAFRNGSGSVCVLTVNARGLARAFDNTGRPIWAGYLPERPSLMPIAAELSIVPGQELLAALEDGRLVAMFSDGTPLWERQLGGPIAAMYALRTDSNALTHLALLSTGANPALGLLDNAGKLVWSTPLPATVQGGTLVRFVDNSRSELVCVTGDNRLRRFALASGEAVSDVAIELRGEFLGAVPIRFFDLESPDSQPGSSEHSAERVVSAGTKGLTCHTIGGETLWSLEVNCTAPPAVYHSKNGAVSTIVVPFDSGLVAIDSQGRELWRDKRSVMPVASTPAIVEAAPGRAVIAYTSPDYQFRVIECDIERMVELPLAAP